MRHTWDMPFGIGSAIVAGILITWGIFIIPYVCIKGYSLYIIIPAFIGLICGIIILAVEIYTFKNYKENEYIIKNGIKIGGQIIEVKPLDKNNKILELKCFGLIEEQEYQFTGVIENKNGKNLLGQTVIIYVNPTNYDRYVLQTF